MIAKEKKKYTIDSRSSLYEALAAIEANAHRSLIVLAKETVVGTLSDGDIRKALLDNRMLNAPVGDIMNTRFISLRESERARAKKIFAEAHIFLIPVVDDRSRLLDIIESY